MIAAADPANPAEPFEAQLAASAAAVEERLSAIFAQRPADGEIARPDRLLQAVRYAVLNGGKRLRPHLVIASTALFDATAEARDSALSVAAALECIHCYSLVHDDLPAMDDDDMRRGLPTTHIAFDVATAILAGDALQTEAFAILSDDSLDLPAERKLRLVQALARAAGLGGMAGGQMLDLDAERERPDETGIIKLQAMKTGALIRFACEAGPVIAGAPAVDRDRLRQFGETIGLAFQLADDLLDMTSNPDEMGKATGKDAGRGKATLVGMHGLAWAENQLAGLVREAEDLLAPFGDNATALISAARFVALRKR